MQTLHFPAQLKSLMIVAPFLYPGADIDRDTYNDRAVKYDAVSTEKDWIVHDGGGIRLLRHKQAILSPATVGSAGSGHQAELKETYIAHRESVFRDDDWDKIPDLEPTYVRCHE